VVPHDRQSAGVQQYRDMVDASLEDTPVPEPQRPASADEEDEADAFDPVELHMPEGTFDCPLIALAWGMHGLDSNWHALLWHGQLLFEPCMLYPLIRLSLPLVACASGTADAFAGDADMDEGLAEDLKRARLAAARPATSAASAAQRAVPSQDPGRQGASC
jgi:hypothetical protein